MFTTVLANSQCQIFSLELLPTELVFVLKQCKCFGGKVIYFIYRKGGLDFESMNKQGQNVMVVWELGIWLAAFCVKSKRGQIGANNLGIGHRESQALSCVSHIFIPCRGFNAKRVLFSIMVSAVTHLPSGGTEAAFAYSLSDQKKNSLI